MCQFHRGKITKYSAKLMFLRRVIAIGTVGKVKVEEGDMLHLNIEFAHTFSSVDALRSELEEGGLEVIRIQTDINPIRGGAVCRKAPLIP